MENRRFDDDFMPNNRDRGEMLQQQQQQQNRRVRIRKQKNPGQMIFCEYCRNKMPPSCMAGKFFGNFSLLNFTIS